MHLLGGRLRAQVCSIALPDQRLLDPRKCHRRPGQPKDERAGQLALDLFSHPGKSGLIR